MAMQGAKASVAILLMWFSVNIPASPQNVLKRVSLCKEIQFQAISNHCVPILDYRNVFLQIEIFNDIFQREK